MAMNTEVNCILVVLIDDVVYTALNVGLTIS